VSFVLYDCEKSDVADGGAVGLVKEMLVMLTCVPVMFRYWPSTNWLKEHILMLSALISVLLTAPRRK